MKKFSAFLSVLLVVIAVSACSSFHNETQQNYPQAEPYTATVFLQVNDSSVDLTLALLAWKVEVMTSNTLRSEDEVRIISEPKLSVESDGVYRADLEITHMPDNTMTKTVRPWKIYYTQSFYNPIVLLPESEIFTYMVMLSSERRHSASSADKTITVAATAEAPTEYIYAWTQPTEIKLVDVYPNRPLYFAVVITGAALIALVVFLINRYNDCKKQKKNL